LPPLPSLLAAKKKKSLRLHLQLSWFLLKPHPLTPLLLPLPAPLLLLPIPPQLL
jgi:hypothetical protein